MILNVTKVSCGIAHPNYVRNLLGRLRRATCWDQEAK
jgi:hypothetical protein